MLMIIGLFILVLKTLLAFVAFYLLFMVYKDFMARRDLDFYEKQGITVALGSRRFFVGNIPDVFNFAKLKENQ